MVNQVSNIFQVGDQVTFDSKQIDGFKEDTKSDDIAVRRYQRLVLGGVGQVGLVEAFDEGLTTVYYKDGWSLPVPTKYLILFEQA